MLGGLEEGAGRIAVDRTAAGVGRTAEADHTADVAERHKAVVQAGHIAEAVDHKAVEVDHS